MTAQQAFPGAYCVGPNDDLYPPTPGMTLRDWYAGQALSGFAQAAYANGDWSDDLLARLTYKLADAMLAARNVVTSA